MPPFLRRFLNLLLPTRHNAYRPRLLHRRWLIGILGLALLCEGVIVGNALLHLKQGPAVFLAAVVRSDIVEYTDQARMQEGGAPLTESDLLTVAAQAKAEDMARYGYFSHTGPGGEEPWVWIERAGYDYQYAGENLAVRFEDSKDIVDAWMDSPGHRANIVKPQYTDIGVGIAQGQYKGGPATFVVQYFAMPALASAPAQAPTNAQAAQAAGISEIPEEASVAGAQTSPVNAEVQAQKPDFLQSLMRVGSTVVSNSQTAAGWALATVAATLAAVIALAFFVRMQVQPTDLLIPGVAVALIMVTFLAANARYLPGSQVATVALSRAGETAEAAAVERPARAGVPRFPEVPSRKPAASRND